MPEPASNGSLAYWLGGVFLSAMIWGLTYISKERPPNLITAPRWMLLLCGIRQRKQIDYRKLEFQMFGNVLFVWLTILAIVVPSQTHRVTLYSLGVMIGTIGLIPLDSILTRESKRSNRD
jgi:hypothetical protein